MAEDLPLLVSRAVKDSLKKLQEENSALKESNLMTRAEVEKLTCNLLMAKLEHSRLEDAMDAELRSTRKEASDLRQKLHLQGTMLLLRSPKLERRPKRLLQSWPRPETKAKRLLKT